MLFFSYTWRLGVWVAFFAISCTPLRTSISESDLERLIERMAERKVQVGLNLSEGQSLPKDWILFREICEIYRLDPDSALDALEKHSPRLAKRIRDSR